MASTRSKTGQPSIFSSQITPIKHLTFHKGEYIGHLEPIVLDSTDQGEMHQANSIMLKKMMSKTVTSDIFDPSQHELSAPIQDSLKLLFRGT